MSRKHNKILLVNRCKGANVNELWTGGHYQQWTIEICEREVFRNFISLKNEADNLNALHQFWEQIFDILRYESNIRKMTF